MVAAIVSDEVLGVIDEVKVRAVDAGPQGPWHLGEFVVAVVGDLASPANNRKYPPDDEAEVAAAPVYSHFQLERKRIDPLPYSVHCMPRTPAP